MEEVIQVGNIVDDTDIGFKNPQRGRIYSSDGLSPCLCDGSGGGGREPKIIEPIGCAMRGSNPENLSERGRSNGKYKQRIEMGSNISNTLTSVQKDSLVAEPLRIPQATKQGYIEEPQGAVFDMSYPESTTRRGRVQEGGQVSPTLMAGGEAPCYFEGVVSDPSVKNPLKGKSDRGWHFEQQVYDETGITRTVKSGEGSGNIPKVIDNTTSYRIRKLTPRECFRLMDVDEKNIDKIIASGVSNSQQYKMAGNSIVTNCMYHLFRKLFIETQTESQQLSLF